MIRTMIWLGFFWGYQIVLAPALLCMLILRGLRVGARVRLRVAQVCGHVWARILLMTTGARVEVEGLERVPREGGFVVMANHQGTFDIPLLLGYLGRPVAFVAKRELRKLPGVSQWMALMGCEFLDRSDRRQAMAVQRRSVEKVRQGIPLVIFPEGTRTGDPEMRAFKNGSLRIALDAQVPVLPISLLHTWSLFEANGRRLYPRPLKMVIHAPLETNGLGKADQAELAKRVQAVITGPLRAAEPGAAGAMSVTGGREEMPVEEA